MADRTGAAGADAGRHFGDLSALIRRALGAQPEESDATKTPGGTADPYALEIDEYGFVIQFGSIHVSELLYSLAEEFEGAPNRTAFARLERDCADRAEARLLALRYIAAARDLDHSAMDGITQALDSQALADNLIALLLAAWTASGVEPGQQLMSLTRVALGEISQGCDEG